MYARDDVTPQLALVGARGKLAGIAYGMASSDGGAQASPQEALRADR